MQTAAPTERAPLGSWLGGAVFVGSLAFAGWRFLFGMGADPAAATPPAVAIDIGLFSVFALHHSIMARSGAKRWLARHAPATLERSAYVWVASLLFAAVMGAWRELPGIAYRHEGLAALPHWLAVAVGVALTAGAVRAIDPLHLAGIRQAAGDLRPDRFSIVGPYHLVRHPIYLGWLLMVFGVPDMTWTRLAFAAISSAYLVVAIPFEERSLVETFGDTYREYQRRVRWRMVPGVW
jgi:protein-S-isoprenylcysteine O-methyltransferase Ste14